ncbi:uncharacterized protein LOC135823118 [Sycon ciliatum]|uniref:uncharacterized protein LOC135823118 n=1 Tax=Sycon ciliatum TaxID=27933 RepID=UPI0031F61D3C
MPAPGGSHDYLSRRNNGKSPYDLNPPAATAGRSSSSWLSSEVSGRATLGPLSGIAGTGSNHTPHMSHGSSAARHGTATQISVLDRSSLLPQSGHRSTGRHPGHGEFPHVTDHRSMMALSTPTNEMKPHRGATGGLAKDYIATNRQPYTGSMQTHETRSQLTAGRTITTSSSGVDSGSRDTLSNGSRDALSNKNKTSVDGQGRPLPDVKRQRRSSLKTARTSGGAYQAKKPKPSVKFSGEDEILSSATHIGINQKPVTVQKQKPYEDPERQHQQQRQPSKLATGGALPKQQGTTGPLKPSQGVESYIKKGHQLQLDHRLHEGKPPPKPPVASPDNHPALGTAMTDVTIGRRAPFYSTSSTAHESKASSSSNMIDAFSTAQFTETSNAPLDIKRRSSFGSVPSKPHLTSEQSKPTLASLAEQPLRTRSNSQTNLSFAGTPRYDPNAPYERPKSPLTVTLSEEPPKKGLLVDNSRFVSGHGGDPYQSSSPTAYDTDRSSRVASTGHHQGSVSENVNTVADKLQRSQPFSTSPPTKQSNAGSSGASREYDPAPPQRPLLAVMPKHSTIGLKNIGNTCYMNCILQCLSHTRPLRDYALCGDMEAFLRSKSKTWNARNSTGTEFVTLIKTLWDKGRTIPFMPSELKARIGRANSQFRGSGQQDANEFFHAILSELHDELKVASCSQLPSLPENFSKLPVQKQSDLMWSAMGSKHDSQIRSLFHGQLQSRLSCCVCGNLSVTFEEFQDLQLPIPQRSSTSKPRQSNQRYSTTFQSLGMSTDADDKAGRGAATGAAPSYSKTALPNATIHDCLSAFTDEEQLSGADKPFCSECGRKQNSQKKFTVQRLPKILVLHLKRFEIGQNGQRKIGDLVVFDSTLDMSSFSSGSAGSTLYQLYAVANHTGTVRGGHYRAHCCNLDNPARSREWKDYDDQSVRPVQKPTASHNPVCTSQAYILFYERID